MPNHHHPIPYPYICQNLVLVLVVLKVYINLILEGERRGYE